MRPKAGVTSDILEIVTASPASTFSQGGKLSRLLKPGDIVCLKGDLGTGKTVFTKGISAGLGIKACEVISPTFVLMRCHRGRLPLYHFDLYRVESPDEIIALGYEEFFFSDGVCVIEWAERLGYLAPEECLTVELFHLEGKRRLLRFSGRGARCRELLGAMRKGRTR